MANCILFLGPPGSGKGTQAQRLSDKLGFQQISTGDLLRENVRKKSKIGLQIQKVIEKGDLVSDDLILDIMKERLSNKKDNVEMFILDGFPRTIIQAERLYEMLNTINLKIDFVFNFKLSVEEVISRITNRLICKVCNKIYKKSDITEYICSCEKKGELISRMDDQADKAKHRYEQYLEMTKPLEIFYQKNIIDINAKESEEYIFSSIVDIISKKKNKKLTIINT